MGDLIQSSLLVKKLRLKYPDSKISLLVDEAIMELAENLSGIDVAIGIDMKGLSLSINRNGHGLVKQYAAFSEAINKLREKRFDMIFNLNYSNISSIIAHLLNPEELKGFRFSEEERKIVADPWFSYLINSVSSRRLNRINLADIFSMADDGRNEDHASEHILIGQEELRWAAGILQKHRIGPEQIIIGLNPGAGMSKRQWPAEYFSKLSDLAVDKLGAKVILFGISKEEELGKQIERTGKFETINLIGKTSLGELIAILSLCRYLVTNDTGTMHIAAAVRTKVVGLFMGPANCHETGPYGNGHLILQTNLPCSPCYEDGNCKDQQCRFMILPEDVFEVMSKDIENRLSDNSDIKLSNNDISLFRSEVDRGLVKFLPIAKKEPSFEDILAICYREMWKSILDNEEFLSNDRDMLQELISCYSLPLRNGISGKLWETSQKFSLAADIFGRGGSLSKKYLDNNLSEDSFEFEVNEIEKLLKDEEDKSLKPLVNFYLLEKKNITKRRNSHAKEHLMLFNKMEKGARFLMKQIKLVESKNEYLC